LAEPRVLITTYHQAFLLRGGGEYEIFSIADALKRSGMIADIYGPYSRSLDCYDVILHFSVHGGGLDLLKRVRSAGKPVVLWPNLWVREVSQGLVALVNEHVQLADVVVFKSSAELMHFSERFALPPEKALRVPIGADSSYLRPAQAGLFTSLYVLDRYAIWFGVIEPSKNQLAAIRVLREKGIPLVLVGHSRDEQYYKKCIEAGGDGVLFIQGLPQKSEIVRSALRDSLFYIEISYEPPGLSAIEAGLSGCKLVLSASDWSYEHFGEHAIYADPSHDDTIARAVDSVLSLENDSSKLVAALKPLCLPDSIEPLIEILHRVMR
jgi:glycosyltransferase involved in cell wall biosynthesis